MTLMGHPSGVKNPARAPDASVCAPGTMFRHCIADQPGKGVRTMSFHRWLHDLRSVLATGQGQRPHHRRGAPGAATPRPHLEVLEDRLTPSFSPAVSYP